MSPPVEAPSFSPQLKRRRGSSPVNENKLSSQQTSITELSPPMSTCAPPASSSALVLTTTAVPPVPSPVAYYPVYTTHAGHFYIASPPLQPTPPPPSPHHPTKILPKLPPNHHQAPPTPITLPTSPSSSSVPYTYYHPYQVSPSLQPIHSSAFTHPYSLQSSSITTTADQREQARRQSHSAIERRRREKINDKIMQLKQLIPTCADQDNLHKMSILQSAIEYITYLQEILEKTDNDDVEKKKDRPIKLNWDLKKNNPGIETPPSSSSPSSYTSPFSTKQQEQYPTTTTTSESPSSSLSSTHEKRPQKQQHCLKPMDVFMSKNAPTTAKSSSSNAKESTPEISDTPKNMSLKNMLC